jgi:hypothetical protein
MASLVLVPLAAKWDTSGTPRWILLNTVVPQLAQVSGTSDQLVVTLDDTYIQFISCQVTPTRAGSTVAVNTIAFNRDARTLTINLQGVQADEDQIHVLAVFSEQIVA